MAQSMKVSGRYGTHLPCLISIAEKTSGPMLELGMGLFSTPYLHYKAMLDDRELVSYENCKPWMDFFIKYGYENKNHEILFVEDYENAAIERRVWDLVLVDQTPDLSRIETVKRLVNLANYIVIHDSNKKMDNIYHYSEIYPLFKYKAIWDKDSNHATVLSNFVDLTDFFK